MEGKLESKAKEPLIKNTVKVNPYEQLLRRQINNNSTELRYIPGRNNHQQLRYEMQYDEQTVYGDSLSKANFGITISDYNNRILFGKPTKNPQQVCKSIKPVPVNIKKTFETTELIDDFYSNPMDWSVNGFVYLSIGRTIYSYKPSAQCLKKVHYELNDNAAYISALCTNSTKALFTVFHSGADMSYFSLMDLSTGKNNAISTIVKGSYRVMRSVETNPNLFFVGNSRGAFDCLDIRAPKAWPDLGRRINEICGMSISGDIIATGDNGNRVRVWDIKNLKEPFFQHDNHNAAVKALAISPFNNALLASAGGTADKTIQLWDIKNNELISMEDTGQQTCNLHWVDKNIVVTTNGYSDKEPSLISAWKIQDTTLIHSGSTPPEEGRTLYSTQNPNNPHGLFAGTAEKDVKLITIGDEKKESPSAFSFNINAIR